MKKFLVYKIKNNINGKSYVGQYSGLSFEKYFGSGKLIKLAIKKYGLENFSKTILEECLNKYELNEKEIFWIDKLKTIGNGYNLTEVVLEEIYPNLLSMMRIGLKTKDSQQKSIGTISVMMKEKKEVKVYLVKKMECMVKKDFGKVRKYLKKL